MFPIFVRTILAAIFFSIVEICPAERWTLVDFGTSDANSSKPYSDWNQIIRHPSNVQYVDPDGDPVHQGITEVDGLAEEAPSYAGIRGTTPITFRRGHKIIATFYNRSENEVFFYARISLTDPDSPDPADTAHAWYTLYGDIGYGMPGQSLVEMEYYISDALMVNHPNSPPSVGDAFLVNVNKRYPDSNIVLTRIEFSDEADITPPTAPGNLQAVPYDSTTSCGKNLIRLSWTASTDPAPYPTGMDRYLIYRNGELHGILPNDMMTYYGPDNLHYIDLNVEPGATYRYTVTALDAAPFGMYPREENPARRHGNESAHSTTATLTAPAWSSATLIDPWGQIEYLGGIRLPVDLESFMDYASCGIAYYPQGNAAYNPDTEWTGSLYLLTKYCERVCEINIPKAIQSSNIEDLPRAATLKAPADLWPRIYGGNWFPNGGGGATGGIAYHPGGNGVGGYLYYGISDFYGTDEAAPAHGVFNLSLTQGIGAWHIGGIPPANISAALHSMILFPISQTWADLHTGGRSLVVGSNYIAGLGVPSHGTSLYALAPWETGSLPPNGGSCTAVELVRYSSGAAPEHRVINWAMGEWGEGGAWLEISGRSVVAISHIRSIGDSWYGDSLGSFHCLDDIPEPPFGEKGTAATDWKTSLMLFNPADLADVAQGKKQNWEPQPYCVFDIEHFSMRPGGGDGIAGAVAFDTANKRLYYIEHNGDPGYEYGYGMIHVFALTAATEPPAPALGWIAY